MTMTTLNKIYPRDRLSVADVTYAFPTPNLHIGDAELPELLAYLIETKLNTHSDHRMVINISDRTWQVNGVKVYSGNEHLGTLGVEWYPLKITLINRTIRERMTRKGYMASGNANTLSAKYDKFIRPASAIQKSSILRQTARRAMQDEHSSQTEKQHPVETFVKHLTDHIMDNFDKYKDIAVSDGFSYRSTAQGDLLNTLPSLHSDCALVHNIVNKKGFYFYTENETCLAIDQKGKKVGAHYANTLPEKLAAKVGMLKLANDKTFVRDVGYRQQQDFFYISGDYNEYT
jgi:hypothetical protein